MAPRKGVFTSNKVKPGNFKNFRSEHIQQFTAKDAGSFFIKPATSGSTTEHVNVEKKKLLREIELKKEKKPFDKKKWRMQRYSKKYKVQQWEEKRKKAVLTEYYKQVDDRPKFDVKKIYEEESIQEGHNRSLDQPNVPVANEKDLPQNTTNKRKARLKAHEEFQRINEEKRKSKEDFLKKKVEMREAMKRSREERLIKFKRLNKKTKKGQPIMKERMELLLEQIQKNLEK